MKIRFVSAAFIATISLATFAAGPCLRGNLAGDAGVQQAMVRHEESEQGSRRGKNGLSSGASAARTTQQRTAATQAQEKRCLLRRQRSRKKRPLCQRTTPLASAQQKKDCDAKWDANKTKTGAHGWHDYFQFMAKCM